MAGQWYELLQWKWIETISNGFPLMREDKMSKPPSHFYFLWLFHILLSNNPFHYTSTLTIWVEDNLAFFQLILFSGIPYLHGRPSQSLLWWWSKICINWGWVSHIAIHMKKQTGQQLNLISTQWGQQADLGSSGQAVQHIHKSFLHQ